MPRLACKQCDVACVSLPVLVGRRAQNDMVPVPKTAIEPTPSASSRKPRSRPNFKAGFTCLLAGVQSKSNQTRTTSLFPGPLDIGPKTKTMDSKQPKKTACKTKSTNMLLNRHMFSTSQSCWKRADRLDSLVSFALLLLLAGVQSKSNQTRTTSLFPGPLDIGQNQNHGLKATRNNSLQNKIHKHASEPSHVFNFTVLLEKGRQALLTLRNLLLRRPFSHGRLCLWGWGRPCCVRRCDISCDCLNRHRCRCLR